MNETFLVLIILCILNKTNIIIREKFIWKDFKMTILLREEGSADFLSRMANFDIK